MAPAGETPGTPRHAGIRAKKKGLETIQALLIGGGGGHRTHDLIATEIGRERFVTRMLGYRLGLG
jgi:hypothetical protein